MKRTLLSSCLFCTLALLAFSSEDPLQKVIDGFKKYLEEVPQEKVYLHFDRPYYTSGETIWLKAYLTAGALHEPSPFSNTIYVELLDQKHSIVKEFKLLAVDGSAPGHIDLPDSLSSGNYLVRAYTNWMRNAGEDYFFHRSIKIWNQQAINSPSVTESNAMDIQFFPEGGDLVNGITSKVAVKAIGSDGLGRKIKGSIVDDAGVHICDLQSNHLGMGVFMLKPEAGKKYKAIIENSSKDISLPSAKDKGLVLTVMNIPSQSDITVRIQLTDYKEQKQLYLLAQTRGIVCYSASVNLSSNMVLTKIPRENFPQGITQITVLDTNGQPLAERLAFVERKGGSILIEATPDKASYKPREKIVLTIKAKDEEGKPVASDLSLSVVDNSQVLLDENAETITSYLFLGSELRGYIESSGYYFNPNNPDRAVALDYLLLTQGWRRFTVKQAMEEAQKPTYKFEQGLSITGKLVDKFNGKPIANGKVTYLVVHPQPGTKVVKTDDLGKFEINQLIYFDSSKAVIQGETRKGGKLVKFILDSIFTRPAATYPIFSLNENITEFERNFISKSVERKNLDMKYNFDEKTIVLDEVEVKDKKEESPAEALKMYGKGSVSVKVADDPNLENLMHPLQLLQGRVAGVQITGNGLSWTVKIRGTGSINAGTTPLIMVDNIPVSIDYLSMVRVRDIESYEVWKGAEAAIFGAQGANGAIGFYTRRGGGSIPPREGVFNAGNIGYQTEREFYAPMYDVQKPEHVKPDKRVTLFWAPLIQTDSTGLASVTFYNYDLETTVAGIVEGISTTGKPGTSTFKYPIKKD